MLHRASLIFIWTLHLIFSFAAHKAFLVPCKSFKKIVPPVFIAVVAVLASTGLLIPESALSFAGFVSTVIILFPALFYHGSLINKSAASLLIYINLIVSDMLSTLTGDLIQIAFTATPITGNIITTGTFVSLTSYKITYTALFLLSYRFILPRLKHYVDIFGDTFFLRMTGPFLLLYIVSNLFSALLYSDSMPLFIIMSLIFFLFIVFLTRHAMQSFRFFVRQQNKHTQLLLEKKQLEQQTAHLKELAEQYRIIRKQNHEISSHLTALSYLVNNEQWNDILEYIDRLPGSELHRYM